MGRDEADGEARRRARVAHVNDLVRLTQPADAATMDRPLGALPDDVRAEQAHRRDGRQHVRGIQEAADAGFANGARAQHHRPMRNGLVAGNANLAGQRTGFPCDGPDHSLSLSCAVAIWLGAWLGKTWRADRGGRERPTRKARRPSPNGAADLLLTGRNQSWQVAFSAMIIEMETGWWPSPSGERSERARTAARDSMI